MVYIAYAVILNFIEAQLWHTYTLLTTVESSFRCIIKIKSFIKYS